MPTQKYLDLTIVEVLDKFNPMKKLSWLTSLTILFAFGYASLAVGSSVDQAKRIHDRIAGVPPSATVLSDMITFIDNNNPQAAASLAIENENFYLVTLKNMVAPMTNVDQDVFVPLDDYSATFIGIVLNDIDFRQVLSGNIIFVGDPSLNLTPYAPDNNLHYEALESAINSNSVELSTALVQRSQSDVIPELPADATAGVLTTRAAAKAFFYAGTNRANFRFTLLNYLCKDLEQIMDVTLTPDRIRQDVSRSPGGDSSIFLNNCIGCHAGMDPMAQAFAYYEWDYDRDNDPMGELGRLVYNSSSEMDATTGTRVQAKYHINSSNFPYGYVTPDDSWENYWRASNDQTLGWDAALSGRGNGAKSMGQELAHSEQFAQCQVEKVFQQVCFRPPSDSADRSQIASMITNFKNAGYNLKQAFIDSSVYCMGD